ncbi:hypothetical protein GPL17_22965 [Bradyrhizobium yuanmingense]|uniref:hypothetical protein n=1 Tax=Bradyrhizobium yuanmingense TaxID=108015 RepID=UPI0012F92F77|nr:hypothetical protein [Bradyrhizobium yuanmingense]MVT53336.1 hypothetical protein [Bradyrhizobium yuanmingense]
MISARSSARSSPAISARIYAQSGGDYLVLFCLGGGAVVLALAIDLGGALIVPRRS